MSLKDGNIGSYLKSYKSGKSFEKYNFLRSNRYKLSSKGYKLSISEYKQKNSLSEIAGVFLIIVRIDNSKYANVAFVYIADIYIDNNGNSKLKDFKYVRTLKSKKDSEEIASFRNEEKDLTDLFKDAFNNDIVQSRLVNTGVTPNTIRQARRRNANNFSKKLLETKKPKHNSKPKSKKD